MPSENTLRSAFRLNPYLITAIQVAIGISIIVGMSIVTALAAGRNLGFLTTIGLFFCRTQTGLIVLCAFAWLAHAGEAVYGIILLRSRSVPTDLVIQWGILVFVFGFLSLGPLRKRIKQIANEI